MVCHFLRKCREFGVVLLVLTAIMPMEGFSERIKNTFIVTVISPEKIETLHLLLPLDYVSYLSDTLESAKPNSEGRFVFQLDATPGQRILFAGGTQVWSAFAEPTPACTLVLRDRIQEPVVVAPLDGYNALTSTIRKQSKDIYLRFANHWDSLYFAFSGLRKNYVDHPVPFVRDFADYHLTYNQVDAATHLLRYDLADTLERQLLRRHPVDYSHAECMQFIQQMALNRMMIEPMRHYCRTALKQGDLPSPIELLACEMQYYPNGQLRELYMLMGVKLCAQQRLFEDETKFREMAGLILDKVKRLEHLAIAANLRRRYLQ